MSNDRAESLVFHLLTNELIASDYGLRFQAMGRSMLPAIKDGEIVHVQPVAGSMLRIGDIILLRSGGEFKAHRIIRKRGKRFITRGDTGIDTDVEIRCDQILGRVIAKEPINSRRVVRIDGARSRFAFFASEVRRRVATFIISCSRKNP